MKWEGHVARVGEMPRGFWWGGLRIGDHLENLGVDGTIIIKCIFNTHVPSRRRQLTVSFTGRY